MRLVKLCKNNICVALIFVIFFTCFVQTSHAGIKVVGGDAPAYVSGHGMGNQVIKHSNGYYSLNGVVTGFATAKFPAIMSFKTMTNFVSVARYQPVLSSLVLTDSTGRYILGRSDFDMRFDRPGSLHTQIVDWKISFPGEGFYAMNIFIDGTLVGYFPFYVSNK